MKEFIFIQSHSLRENKPAQGKIDHGMRILLYEVKNTATSGQVRECNTNI